MSKDSNAILPKVGRLAGIDYGTVRIGIAICDPNQSIASPLETYQRQPANEQKFFCDLVERESIVGFVVGLPIHLSGDESQKSNETRKFGAWLRKVTDCPVAYFDERLSTAAAAELLESSHKSSRKKKAALDRVAAQIILSSYLESNRKTEHHGPLDDSE